MRLLLPGILAMAIIVVASNILVQYPLGAFLTWGAFTYPFAFLVNEIVNRFEGSAAARKVVLAGFLTGIACSFIGTQIQGEFGPLVTFRIALGSGTAFLAAQLLDITIFNRFRRGLWWKAPLIGSQVASVVDTGVFFFLAFAGTSLNWLQLAGGDLLVKAAMAVLLLAPYRALLPHLQTWSPATSR